MVFRPGGLINAQRRAYTFEPRNQNRTDNP